LAAPIELGKLKLSANWMAACGEPGEDAALFDTVQAVGMELCPELGISIPVGKDSLSMKTRWQDQGQTKQVTSPVSLIITAFASLVDVRGSLTPQLNASDDTSLILVDLGKGQHRMGASILAQVLDQAGGDVPDLDDAQDLIKLVNAVNDLRQQGLLLAYHDRSDGGLWATVCEMAFAGQVGVALNVDLLVHEGDGIHDSRADHGDSKNWAQQVAARRDERTMQALFNEELGVVIQVQGSERDRAIQVLRQHGLSKHSHVIGKTRPAKAEIQRGVGQVSVWRDAKEIFSASLQDLQQVWDSVSWKICRERDNLATADAEHAAAGNPSDPGLHVHLVAGALDNVAAPYVGQSRPRVAILRDWVLASAGHAASLSTPNWPNNFKPFLNAKTRLAWAFATAAKCLLNWRRLFPARNIGPASPPTKASALKPACRWWKCWTHPVCFSKAWLVHDCRSPWLMVKALPTLKIEVMRRKPSPPCLLSTTTVRPQKITRSIRMAAHRA
jgi:phosphoribosylformylglycinamidine synthase